MREIHPTAVVAATAELGEDVVIGPYCVIGSQVRVGARTRLISHVNLEGCLTLGEECTVSPFASLGGQTQDLKYKGGNPRAVIGARTTIREYVTVNCATFDEGLTEVGTGCHIMAYTHVAHDCRIGNSVIMANAATLAGHVVVEDEAVVGGLVGIHQFVRIGKMSIIGGCAKVVKDVPPFMMADGNPLAIHATNLLGLKRRGVPEESQRVLREAYKILYRQELSVSQAVQKIEAELSPVAELQYLLDFIKRSERGIQK